MRTNIPWGADELELAGTLASAGTRPKAIAAACNSEFHSGRAIRTHRSVEFALLEKLGRSKKRFEKTCVVCGSAFPTSWPQARYCGDDCRAVVDREFAQKSYRSDPASNISDQQKRCRERAASRWSVILALFGDYCGKCRETFPLVVYDLHHPNGKLSRRDTPSRVIRTGSEDDFQRLLTETVLLCANCHRLTHAESGDWAPARRGQ